MAFSDEDIAAEFEDATYRSSGSSTIECLHRLEAGWNDGGGKGPTRATGVAVVERPSAIGADYTNLDKNTRYALKQIDLIRTGRTAKEARRILRLYARARLHNARIPTDGRVLERRIWQAITSPESQSSRFLRLLALRAYRTAHPTRMRDRPRKLTDGQVRQIRIAYATGKGGYKALAKTYKIASATVNQIVHGDIYRSAGGPIKDLHAAFLQEMYGGRQ